MPDLVPFVQFKKCGKQCLKISVTCRIDLALKKLVAKARRRGHEKCKSIGSITGTGHDSTRQDAKGSKGM